MKQDLYTGTASYNEKYERELASYNKGLKKGILIGVYGQAILVIIVNSILFLFL